MHSDVKFSMALVFKSLAFPSLCTHRPKPGKGPSVDSVLISQMALTFNQVSINVVSIPTQNPSFNYVQTSNSAALGNVFDKNSYLINSFIAHLFIQHTQWISVLGTVPQQSHL